MSKKKIKPLNEAQLGDDVIFQKKRGTLIGKSSTGDWIVQLYDSGHTDWAKDNQVKVINARVESVKPPQKFDSVTQKLLFEQYVKCGIFMGNTPVKTNDCYVKYSDWKDAGNTDHINVFVEGKNNLMEKALIKIFEDVNSFANIDNFVEGVIVDEETDEALENVLINVIDYTQSVGDADTVTIIRNPDSPDAQLDELPKSMLRTLSV